jgi:hypothetical protein
MQINALIATVKRASPVCDNPRGSPAVRWLCMYMIYDKNAGVARGLLNYGVAACYVSPAQSSGGDFDAFSRQPTATRV